MQRCTGVLLLVCLLGLWGGSCNTAHTQPVAVDGSIGAHEDGVYQDVQAAADPQAAAGGLLAAGSTAASGGWLAAAQQSPNSGQLLFQSIPNFPEAELQALNTFTGILRSRSPPQHQRSADSSVQPQGDAPAPAHSRSAADDFIEALLKTTRASLARSNPSLLWPLQQRWDHNHRQGQDSQKVLPGESSTSSRNSEGVGAADTAAEEEEEDEVDVEDAAADIAGGSEPDADSTTEAEGSLQDGLHAQPQHALSTRELPAAAAAMDPAAEGPSSTQQIADTASAVEGQVLVTQAELIPAMQDSYGQVVLTSLKMRPMPAQELLAKVSASPADAPSAAAKAAAWQDNLKQALEAAAALEANTSVTQMHTRMTSILNLGLELAEPPLAYASAAASSVAGSIKALTRDESVLVGVSLIRLGPHLHLHDLAASTGKANSSQPAAAAALAAGGHAAAPATARSSMLAMLTLYGIGAPTNAVQISQRMQEACPELFVFGASLAGSVCGRNIISNYVAAVLAAEKADKTAGSSPSIQAPAAPGPHPSRTLLQQGAHGVSFSSRLTTTRGPTGGHTFAASASFSAGGHNNAEAENRHQARAGSSTSRSSSARAEVAASSSSAKAPAAVATAAAFAVSRAEQHSPEMEAFIHHSHDCLRVRQQPEVNIIITQAVGVAAGQQPGLLAEKLQQLTQSPALSELLTLSGLTLAQSSKPQIINLAGTAAAGLGREGTLAAAALGPDAAALGQALGSNSGGSGDGASEGKAAGGRDGVATPAVIGVAVAVAVSVVAVCVAAVAIVVVKQRAKQARAAAAAADDQLPKSNKRRRSNKGKGNTSKYLPTSHPVSQGGSSPGIPPPPCVIVTARGSPSCQHTSSDSPGKQTRPAPLASAGSSALLSLGSGPGGSGTQGSSSTPNAAARTPPAAAYAGLFLGPAVTRGDSVSSAVMQEFAEQRQQLAAEHGSEGEEAGSDGEEEEEVGAVQQQMAVRGTASLAGPLSPLCTLRHQGSHSAHPSPVTAAAAGAARPGSGLPSCSSPFHQLRQQWQGREACGSSCSSPACSPYALPGRARACAAAMDAGDAGAAATAAGAEALRLFSRPLSESSLPEELTSHLAAAAAAGAGTTINSSTTPAAAPAAATPSSAAACASQHDSGFPALSTLRTLHSVSSGSHDRTGPAAAGPCSGSGRYSSGGAARASPFMAYDVSVLLASAASTQSSPLAASAAAAAMTATSFVADSLQIPQWASSIASSSVSQGLLGSHLVAGLRPAGSSCASDGVSSAAVGSPSNAGMADKAGRTQLQSSLGPGSPCGQARASPRASVRATPFMQPRNLPPGLE